MRNERWTETWEEVNELVKSVTYKPGWELILLPFTHTGLDFMSCGYVCKLRIVMEAVDVRYDDKRVIPVMRDAMIPLGMPESVTLQCISDAIWAVELHEFNEFFRINGQVVNDPHKKKETHVN